MRYLILCLTLLLAACDTSTVENRAALPDFVSLAEQNAPAVVNISTELDPAAHGNMRDQLPDFLEQFLDEFDNMPEGQPEEASMGSGFIISGDGYILTTRHVVAGADRIIVRLSDYRELEAEMVGEDPRSDIALLKVDASGLPVVEIGSSEKLRVGEWVLAIGAPFGFDSSVTAGVVSATGRSLPSENYVPFIQTDVAINPGNSGGPLFDLDGRVVGINSQIISRNGGYMGLSFAIPIDFAMDVVEQLKETGRVERGWLGVMIQQVDRELAESFGLERPIGALVAQVLPDSPAAAAGIQPGDVIVSFDGEEITESARLPQLVGVVGPGTRADIDLVRDGEKKTVSVTVAALPDNAETRFQPGFEERSPQKNDQPLGLETEPVAGDGGGLRVVGVKPGPAREAGIREGDVIVSVNNRAVGAPEDLRSAVRGMPSGSVVPVLVSREGNPRFLALRLP